MVVSQPDERRFAVSRRVLSRVLDGDAVLLDLGSGNYFGLNAVGTAIWQALGEGATVAELEARVLAEFDVDRATARRELEDLLADLLARGLIE